MARGRSLCGTLNPRDKSTETPGAQQRTNTCCSTKDKQCYQGERREGDKQESSDAPQVAAAARGGLFDNHFTSRGCFRGPTLHVQH